jgi:hypothetical protein
MFMDVSGIPRYEPPNPYNYTDDQKADKALALAKMKIIYPTVDSYYAEMVYDMCVNTKKEELDEIKKRVETNPFKYNYANLQAELDKVKENWEKQEDTSLNTPLSEVTPIFKKVLEVVENE